MTWYRATPSAGTVAWITPADDIWKTLAPPAGRVGQRPAKAPAGLDYYRR
jgi:hypothetical protein